MNFYWRRVESQEKLQRRGNSVHNITLVGFRGQKLGTKFHEIREIGTGRPRSGLHKQGTDDGATRLIRG